MNLPKKKRLQLLLMSLIMLILNSCGVKADSSSRETLSFLAESESVAAGDVVSQPPLANFNADSAYSFIQKQVDFGPRVPNTEAHKAAGNWLSDKLRGYGLNVIEQKANLKAFDGTMLNARNIFAQYNPDKKERVLLLAHWDCRPWADMDPDPAKKESPIDGANDGASGVGVLLEIARQLSQNKLDKGVDILLVDAEDWGTEGDDDSWALGTKYFAENPPVKGYSPVYAVLLDMVGGENAIFCREYFSEKAAPSLAEKIWQTAASLGYGNLFLNRLGSAVLDDHVQLIRAGIPAIDIIEYNPESENGFNAHWHTASDNMDGISKKTLEAVGNTLMLWINKY